MNNTFKKIVAVLLSVLTCFSCVITAFAEDETVPAEKTETEITCYWYQKRAYQMNFVVVTFDGKYSQTGEIPEAYVYRGNTPISVTEDLIKLKIYEYEGEKYPQLFINTKSFENIDGIVIGEGAFITESGETSGKVKIPSNKIERAYDLGLSCQLEVLEIEEHVNLITSKTARYGAVGNPVEIVGYGEYGKVWLGSTTATCTFNSETIEITSNEFVPQEPGKYVVELNFDGMVTRTLEIDVLSGTKSYTKNLGNATIWLFLSPLCLVVGTGLFVLIPGFGTWIGSTTVVAAVALIPRFFVALFGGPAYKEYILE